MNTEPIVQEPHQLDLFETSQAKIHTKSVYLLDTNEEKNHQNTH